MPSLLHAPSDKNGLVLTQWRRLYGLGASIAPPLALVSATCSFLNAYNLYHPQVLSRTYKFIGAGLCTLAIVPFTLFGIVPTNKELEAREEGKTGKRDVDTRQLLRQWSNLNAVRAIMTLAGTLLAFDAL